MIKPNFTPSIIISPPLFALSLELAQKLIPKRNLVGSWAFVSSVCDPRFDSARILRGAGNMESGTELFVRENWPGAPRVDGVKGPNKGQAIIIMGLRTCTRSNLHHFEISKK